MAGRGGDKKKQAYEAEQKRLREQFKQESQRRKQAPRVRGYDIRYSIRETRSGLNGEWGGRARGWAKDGELPAEWDEVKQTPNVTRATLHSGRSKRVVDRYSAQ